ncbi:MAG: stage II sporulation protein M [Gammaproteobacteria bacterium]|nr:stage II sporulation protein M [Gammaproteobacteria bacterium]
MKQQRFETDREQAWAAFASQLDQVRQGFRLSSDQDAAQFVAEYRRLARDLSVARARGYSRRLVRYLNDLVVQGHNVVYAYRAGFLRSTLLFLRAGFPQQVRRAWPYMAVACIGFLAPLLGMMFTIFVSPEWVYSVLPAEQVSAMEAMYDPNAEHLGRERQSDTDFMMFGFYIMNNISITFQLFASGLLFGLGSVLYVVANGVFIGATTGHLLGLGYHATFLPFVVGHGALELTALVIAGGGGLMLGHALLAPGMVGRLTALRNVAPRAVQIVIGAALMDLAAAFIEAFWSSSTVLGAGVKYSVGAVLWSLVLGYLVLAGRGVDADD